MAMQTDTLPSTRAGTPIDDEKKGEYDANALVESEPWADDSKSWAAAEQNGH
jgi:hypothetical protein